jgi:hypothetical protein
VDGEPAVGSDQVNTPADIEGASEQPLPGDGGTGTEPGGGGVGTQPVGGGAGETLPAEGGVGTQPGGATGDAVPASAGASWQSRLDK